MSIFPSLNFSIISSFSLGFIFPCKNSTLYCGNISLLYVSYNFSTDFKSISSFSSTNGHTMYACLPSFNCFSINAFTLSVIFLFTANVSIFFLLGGNSSIIEISKSPYNIKANVLGIGVAVITNTSGFSPFSAILVLCFTPNLCCSSVTTKPRFLNFTLSSIIACVPINISISPFSSLSNIPSFCFLVIPDINNSHLIPSFSSIFLKFSKCCVASIAVGAIIAAWYPDFTALYAAHIATTVFPEPTSPCKSLFIFLLDSISLSISSNTLSCAFVNLNGNEFITSDILASLLNSIPFLSVI